MIPMPARIPPLAALALTMALAVLLSGCPEPSSQTTTEATETTLITEASLPRPVRIWTVSAIAPEAPPVWLAGTIQPRQRTLLAFQVGGKLEQRLVEVGESVQAGSVLARLDPRDLELARQAAVADLTAAEADLTRAERELTRVEAVFRRAYVDQSTVDAARAARDAARARVAAAAAQLALRRNQEAYGVLRADSAGVVLSVPVEPGQVMAAGQTVLELALDGTQELWLDLGEHTARRLQPGDRLAVRVWAEPERVLEGVVREIAPITGATQGVRVKLTLSEAARGLRLGLSAEAALPPQVSAASAGVVWIPATALAQSGTEPAVWTLDDSNALRAQPVTVVELLADGVRVSGLSPGARVLAAGVHQAFEGQVVHPLPESGSPGLAAERQP